MSDLPPDATPVDIALLADGWRISGQLSPFVPPSPIAISPTFQEFISSQPEHHAALLPRFQLLVAQADVYTLCDEFSQLAQVFVVSNGGAANLMGLFDWIISSTSGCRLASGSGPAIGYDPRSYRVEAYGIHAGLQFLLFAFTFCNHPLPPTVITFCCDNEGLIKKLHKFQEYPLAPTSCCLHSEWDLLIRIHETIQAFPSLVRLAHVKGHQDNPQAYQDLPLMAQLNMDADALATLEMINFSTSFTQAPFDPVSCAAIFINGVTIT